MTGHRVLVVDSEPGLVRALAANLRANGWDVVTARSGTAALDAAASTHPDVILLDLGLPDMRGADVVTGLRRRTRVPVLVLATRQHEHHKVAALDAGAVGCVTKPIAMNDLLVSLRTAVNGTGDLSAASALVLAGDLEIDMERKQVHRAGQEVRLTRTEWAFLELLVRNTGMLLGREQILEEVWGPSYRTETNYLRVSAAQLRRKLETNPAQPKHIITSAGMGYSFEP